MVLTKQHSKHISERNLIIICCKRIMIDLMEVGSSSTMLVTDVEDGLWTVYNLGAIFEK